MKTTAATTAGLSPLRESNAKAVSKAVMDEIILPAMRRIRPSVVEIWLSTNPDPSVRAHGFYRKLGWRPDGVDPNGEVRYVLRREGS